jgi:hemimethylated DNA binding protein
MSLRLPSIFVIAIVIVAAHLTPCPATTVSIDWVEQPTFPPSVGPITAAGEELPVIFPEFPALFSDATWRSYLKFTTRAVKEADAFKVVKYTPGTVFKHRLFGYRGVIMGATPSCEASEQWIQQMRVDELPGGRKQPFYWTMVDVRDRPVQTTYVAQCNVVPLSTQVLHPDVSSIFRSFDTSVGRYVPLDRSEEDVAKEVRTDINCRC